MHEPVRPTKLINPQHCERRRKAMKSMLAQTTPTGEMRTRLYNSFLRLGDLTAWFGHGKELSNRRKRALRLKVVVLGDTGTGKTSLIGRYLENRDVELNPVPTQYGEFFTRRLVLGERQVKVQIWEIPSHVLVSDINDECFLQRSMGAIFVYDCSNPSSFDNIEAYLRKFRKYAHPGAMCVLLANKNDLVSADWPHQNSPPGTIEPSPDNSPSKWITPDEGRQFADGYSMEFVEASAYSGCNVQEAFNSLFMALNDAADAYLEKQEMLSYSASTVGDEKA